MVYFDVLLDWSGVWWFVCFCVRVLESGDFGWFKEIFRFFVCWWFGEGLIGVCDWWLFVLVCEFDVWGWRRFDEWGLLVICGIVW